MMFFVVKNYLLSIWKIFYLFFKILTKSLNRLLIRISKRCFMYKYVLAALFSLLLILIFVPQNSLLGNVVQEPNSDSIQHIKQNLLAEINSSTKEVDTQIYLISTYYSEVFKKESKHQNALNQTKLLIETSYTDPLHKETFLSLLSLLVYEDTTIDYEIRLSQKEYFSTLISQSSILTEYFQTSGLNQKEYILNRLGKKTEISIHEANYEKDLLEILLLSKIKQDELKYEFESERVLDQEVIKAYQGLLILEQIYFEEQNSVVYLNLKSDSSDSINRKKQDLILSFASYLSNTEKNMYALALIDYSLNAYLSELSTLSADATDETIISSFSYSTLNLKNKRNALVYNEIDLLKLDLLDYGGNLDLLLNQRKGYVENVADLSNLPEDDMDKILAKYSLPLIAGGFGKSVLEAIDLFEETKQEISVLKEEQQTYFKGLFAIQTLIAQGLSYQEIEAWINGELSDAQKEEIINKVLYFNDFYELPSQEEIISGFSDAEISDGRYYGKGVVVNDQLIFVSTQQQKIILDFLEENRDEAYKTYYSSSYNAVLEILIGKKNIYIDPETYDLSHIADYSQIQRNQLKEKLQPYQFNDVEAILNQIDNLFNPVYLGFAVSTSGASTVSGFALNLASNVAIDAGAMSTLFLIDKNLGTNYQDNILADFATGTVYQVAVVRSVSKFIAKGKNFESALSYVGKENLNEIGLSRKIIVQKNNKQRVLVDLDGNVISDKKALEDYLFKFNQKSELVTNDVKIRFGQSLKIIDAAGKQRIVFFKNSLQDGKISVYHNGHVVDVNLKSILAWNPELAAYNDYGSNNFLRSLFEKIIRKKLYVDIDANIKKDALEKFNADFFTELSNARKTGNLPDLRTEQTLRSKSGLGSASEYIVRKWEYVRDTKQFWLYYKGSVKSVPEYFVDGVKAEYKIHITADSDSYNLVVLAMTKKIRDLRLVHKVSPGTKMVIPGDSQYGKVITVYTADFEDVDVLVKEAKSLIKEYGAKGVSPDDAYRNGANLMYEVPIPDTEGIIYYTFESLGSKYLDYAEREAYFKKYWGKGPLDNKYWRGNPFID